MVMAPALMTLDSARRAPLAREAVVLALVLVWGARLTYNWARGWRGLGHEDWRYAEYRRVGRAYWIVSFFGFHLMPTIWVYLGCLSLLPVFSSPRPLSVLDGLALLVTAGAIATEAVADEQLRAFRLATPSPGRVLDTGLWAICRHPNYLGELSFWWGLYLFALAADPSTWWAIVGPASSRSSSSSSARRCSIADRSRGGPATNVIWRGCPRSFLASPATVRVDAARDPGKARRPVSSRAQSGCPAK